MWLRRRHSGLAWASLDLATSLLAVVIAMIAPQKPKATPPRIETVGTYAVQIEWSGQRKDDVDLYVEDPERHIVYFQNTSGGLMNLEHDDIPDVTETDQTRKAGNHERTVIRGVVAGEYVVNVQMYRKVDKGPTTVTVRLWKLRGADRTVRTQTVRLGPEADEQTAFRFTVNARGDVISYSQIQKKLVGQSSPYETANLPSSPAYGPVR